MINQTADDSVDVANENQKATGTGTFLIPEPEKEGGGYRSIAVPNITYDECIRRGEGCMAFRWYADKVLSYEKLQEYLKAQLAPVTSRCKTRPPYCNPGYFCLNGFCVKR